MVPKRSDLLWGNVGEPGLTHSSPLTWSMASMWRVPVDDDVG